MFFGQPYGDHQDIYIKSFDTTKHDWSKAIKMKNIDTKHTVTAHRRSKFAATMFASEGKYCLYFVNVEGNLVEWVSVLMPNGYGWRFRSIVVEGVLPEAYLGVIKNYNKCHVLFQRVSGGLFIASPAGDQWRSMSESSRTIPALRTPC